jgi:predicted phage terminase large subunit-like protein
MDLEVPLLPWQREVFEDPSRFKIVAAGRRTGKSELAAWMLIINGLNATKGQVFYVATTQQQARDILWNTLLKLARPFVKSSHINNLQITLKNDIIISLKGSDKPDTMRGVSLAFLVIDEYADMKEQVWEEILQPALADQQGAALFIGTPKGRNHFYDMYLSAELGKADGFKAWHFTTYDNPFIKREEIEAAKKRMSSHAFRQEFLASFEAKGSNLFKEEWVKFGDEAPDEGRYYIAVDLAGFDSLASAKKVSANRLDDSAIAVVKVNRAGWFVEDIQSGRWGLDETARKIFTAVTAYRPVAVGIEKGIAKQAVMSPLQDMMRRERRYFTIHELTHGNKKKTDRILWALQGRFENGMVQVKKADWNAKFLDQLFQFPDYLTHDDMIDALAYIDQLAQVSYLDDGDNSFQLGDTDPLDLVSGY